MLRKWSSPIHQHQAVMSEFLLFMSALAVHSQLFNFSCLIHNTLYYFVERARQLLDDSVIKCPLLNVTRSVATGEIFIFQFDHVMNDSTVWNGVAPFCADHACHCVDAFYFTAGSHGSKFSDLSETDVKLNLKSIATACLMRTLLC
jgi:hypothetical protein